ncbi:LOW QUALITY PROTEIN: ABC transporter G family member 4-like [Cucurbita moschata]|uniref:LOW QUALITY PROTEIN: ABC transporter G family member 4-like n=1 Tax=Cucurbita moschata TaxID=3662 RepID=A0A6J1G1Y8_CUCMO|nr:LOW QUALITY PROTEIN: ABC transporter G family member 4-like [Cucurbita moschata]
MEEDQPPSRSYTLTTSSITYAKSTTATTASPYNWFKSCTAAEPTYILRDISFTEHPSQILATVGPSGAGKSTLLDILAARTTPTHGAVLLNSSTLNLSTFRKLSTYVPQHDACLPLLTVSETFAFAARLLLPSKSQIQATVDSLLADLRLTHVANTRLISGLSGGERRRVSIGLSLLHDPAVLLLDEPTSGLDSASTFNVISTLKSICLARHRTVVLSIHQPSFRILSAIDRILLLCKGSVIHHGTLPTLESFLVSKEFSIPPQLNPLEFAMEILNQLAPSSNSSSIPSSDSAIVARSNDEDDQIKYRSSRLHEIDTLHWRFWVIVFRTRQLLLTNTLEALIVGIVLGTIYINIGMDKAGIEKRFGLFAFTLTFLLSSTTEALPIFLNERPILLRETSGGVYRLSSYIIANTLVFLPDLLAIAVIYSVSVYFLVGLCATWQAFAYFVLVVWVIILMGNSFVIFLSSLAPNFIAGSSLVTVLLAGFFLFSGYFISEESMPRMWVFMHLLSMYKYALDALLINEYTCLVSRCFVWLEEREKECLVTGGGVGEERGLDETQRWRNVYMLVGFFVFYRLLCLVVLIRRVSRSNK